MKPTGYHVTAEQIFWFAVTIAVSTLVQLAGILAVQP